MDGGWGIRREGAYEAVDLMRDFEHGVVAAFAVFPRSQGHSVASIVGSVEEGEFIFGDPESAVWKGDVSRGSS